MSTKKYCTKCGSEISQNSKFCVSCGAKIKDVDINNKYIKKSNNGIERIAIIAILIFVVGIVIIANLPINNSSVVKNEKKEEVVKEETAVKKEVIKEIKKPILENKPHDLALIIEEWRTKIAYIECNFFYSGLSIFSPSQYGSGTLIRSNNGEITILTNKHMVQQNKNTLYACTIQFPEENAFIVKANHRDDKFLISDNLDSAKIVQKISIVRDTSYTGARISKKYIKRPDYDFNRCETKASIGDSIVVLGYPSIGSKSDITATEGIISGYDGNDYYITSAKVEEGNSGGAVILLKDNCYLGIPTFVMVGDTESMARILSINSLSE